MSKIGILKMSLKQVIIVRTDLKMEKGKIAAQCSHAAVEALEKTRKKNKEIAEEWLFEGMPKIVLKAGSEKELLEIFEKAKKTIPAALVIDAGRTQVEKGSITALGIGPWNSAEIDKLTKHLKLL